MAQDATAPARIGFIAVRRQGGEPDGPLEAIVVGTNDVAGKDWRYVCYPLDRLRTLLDDHRNPFDDADGEADARYHDGLHPGDPLSPHHRCRDDFNPPAAGVIELRNIVTCCVYRVANVASAEPAEIEKSRDVFDEGPLARFDTIGFALTDRNAPALDWFVSRLVLKPLPGQSGRLASFTFDLQIRIALSGHFLERSTDLTEGDRYDPRIVVSLTAARGRSPRSLWKGADGRAAVCDSLRLGLTIRPRRPLDESGAWINEIQAPSNSDLIDLVGQEDSPHGTMEKIDVVPWFADLNIRHPGGKETPAIGRSFGLRIVEGTESNPKRLALRVELEIADYAAATETIFDAVLPPGVPSSGRLPTTGRVHLAQEQRAGDLADFQPRPVQWLVTARLDPAPNTDGISKAVINAYAKVLPVVGKGLRTVRDGRPLSMLPKLSPSTVKDVPWHAVGILKDDGAWRRVILSPAAPIDAAADPLRTTSFISFEPRFIRNMWDGAKTAVEDFSREYRAEFARLAGTRRETPRYKCLISAPLLATVRTVKPSPCAIPPAWQPAVSPHDIEDHGSADLRPGARFAVSLRQLENPRGVELVLGALGFALEVKPDLARKTTEQLAGLVTLHGYHEPPADPDMLPIAIDALIKLPVARTYPVGQDDLPPEVREQLLGRLPAGGRDPYEPLLIELPPAASATRKLAPGAEPEEIIQTLAVTERLARGADHDISIALRATMVNPSEAPPRRMVLVIDPTPLRVGAVEYLEPARAATPTVQEVAVWNAGGENGLSWRVRDESETVRMVLPPQVIGEAMEKNASTLSGTPSDIEPGHAAAARFGAPTRLDIDSTFFDTDYREPGWNLRRNLGYPNQRSPGSRLRELRLELVYGMTTRLRPRDAGVTAWITEMSGTVGAPVAAIDDPADAARPHLKRHLRLARAVLSAQRLRLAVDKIWSDRPDAELRFDDGLAFRLRTRPSAKEVDAGQGDHGPQTRLRWPVPGDIPTDTSGLIDAAALQDTFSTGQDDRDSFPGGVAWAFESANILMKVYGRPDSISGRLQGVHLSAHGGYGAQRALFDENKTIVETETGQGRVHRYKLERIGRIGGLWNRAKHVIIYERTVVPSAQFFNQEPIGLLQDEHAGRPVLRKVEEYVEILQPVRRYPEDGASVSAAGFLIGADFKSRKIRVDSRWGGDVRREGWQVPLWNKAFAASPPADPPNNPDDPSLIYPKPQIRVLLAAEGGAEASAEVAEPEKLVFYTSVVAGESGDNTDLWRPVRDIDFIDLPPPSAGKVAPRSEDLTDAMLPPEPAHDPGYERLTIGLVRANEAAALTHGRTATGPATVLRNITLARAAPLPGGAAASDICRAGYTLAQGSADLRALLDAKIGQALGALEKVDTRLSPAEAKAAAKAGLKQMLDQPGFLDDIRGATTKLGADVHDIAKTIKLRPDPCEAIAARLREVVEGQTARLLLVARQAIAAARSEALAPIDAVGGLCRDTLAQLDSDDETLDRDERAALLDQLSGLQERLLDVLEQARAEIERLDQRVTADVEALRSVAGASFGSAQAELVTAIQAASAGFDALVTAIGNATTVNDSIEAAAKTALRLLEGARNAVNAVADAAGPGERRILVAVNAGLSPVIRMTRNLATPGAPIVTAHVRNTKQAFDELTAKLLGRLAASGNAAIDAAADALKGYLRNGKELALAVLDKVGELLFATYDDDMNRADDGETIFERIDHVIRVLADPGDWGDDYDAAAPLKQALDILHRAVGTVVAEVTTEVDGLAAKLETGADKVKAGVDQAALALTDELKKACQVFEGFFAKLLTQTGELRKWLDDSLDLDGYKAKLERELEDLIDAATGSYEDLKRQAAQKAAEITRDAENRARQLAGSMQESLRDTLGTDPVELADQATRLYQQGSDTLRVLRALGDPPKTDRLGFNRPEVAYVLAETSKIIDMTPAIALVNRVSDTVAAAEQAGKAVGDLLQSFGVRLPSSAIGEQILPEKLKGLSVADLLPNMGGIDFRGLLRNFGFPDLDDAKAIKVRHGFDKTQLTAWLESDIDVPFTEPAPILSFGPVQIMVDDARFNATARMSASPAGAQKAMKGRIAGNWRVVCSGQDILTFRQTALFFDHTGKLDFKIEPERVELAAPLQFLTNFLAAAGRSDGPAIAPLMRGAVPVGVAATIDAQLPDLQLGVFGISNLSLHVLFGVAAIPEFELVCELSVATKVAPFTLSVWILNGGGFLTQRLSFLPLARPRPLLIYSLEVGIVAGVGLGFNFGVVSGGVWLQIGCSVMFTWTTGAGGNATTITVFILARGNVDIAGLVTASISLLLDVSYDGARMIGAGTLRLSFKISMFYTLRVCQRVEYVFAGEKRQPASYSESYN